MDEDLQRLARELRQETCPQRVLDEVARRLSAQARRPRRWGYALAGAAAGLALLCGVALWRRPAGGDTQRHADRALSGRMDSAQIAEQAEGALGYIGQILLEAGSHSEGVILKGAVPPLRSSLETVKNKIIGHVPL